MGLPPSVNGKKNSNDAINSSNSQHSSSFTQNDYDSNNSSSSSSSTALPPVQRQAWTARGQLLLNFHDVISRAINSPEMIQKCSEIAAAVSENEKDPSANKFTSLANDYSAEANLIIENKARRDAEVRHKTISMGLCVFGVLRGGRGVSYLIKRVAANRTEAASRYKFDPLPKSGGKLVETQTNQRVQIKQPPKLREFLRLAVDLAISTTIALLAGQYLFIPRPSSYIEDMAKLPLVEGKSLYAEIVCPSLLREYKRVLHQYGRWPVMSTEDVSKERDTSVPALTQEDVSLNIIRKFAENCSKRSKYEQAILEERNALSEHGDEHHGLELIHRIKRKYSNNKEDWVKLGDVTVPSGGVPEEIAVDLDEDVLSMNKAYRACPRE